MAITALAEGVIQMMWLTKLKLLVAVGAALILATVGVAVNGRQQPAPEGAREQAKTAPPPIAGTGAAAPAVPNIAANRALAREQLPTCLNGERETVKPAGTGVLPRGAEIEGA